MKPIAVTCGTKGIISTIKIVLFLITVWFLSFTLFFLDLLTLVTETVGIGLFQAFVKTLGFTLCSLTLAGLLNQLRLQFFLT